MENPKSFFKVFLMRSQVFPYKIMYIQGSLRDQHGKMKNSEDVILYINQNTRTR